MPVQLPPNLRLLADDDYKRATFEAMQVIFAVHNEMGRLFEEGVYQQAVARRIRGAQIEVPLRVSFEGFVKEYFLDLLVEDGALFEFKVAQTTHDRHRAQLLNYLLLLELPHGKLVNFRNESVEHEFVNAPLTRENRIQFEVEDSDYRPMATVGNELRDLFVRILRDWGTGLDLRLYEEALIHFFGGEQRVVQPVEIQAGGQRIGVQKLPVIAPGTALKITTLNRDQEVFEHHLRRFLLHTTLETIQWVNVNRKCVTFRTLNQK